MPRPCRTRAACRPEARPRGGGADPRSIDGRVVRDRAVAELRRAERAPGSEPALEVAADGRSDGGGDPAARAGCGRSGWGGGRGRRGGRGGGRGGGRRVGGDGGEE